MYWLLRDEEQARVRAEVDRLVARLSTITGNPQSDQLFPFVGRKDRRKARAVVEELTGPEAVVVEPFAGSGSLAYAALEAGRTCHANEWEPYAHRMASAPFRLPPAADVLAAMEALEAAVAPEIQALYRTTCICGAEHVMDSLFFDRDPPRYREVTPHERLGKQGENITYRGRYRCPACGAGEKHFDDEDERLMQEIQATPLPLMVSGLFSSALIENSRINLSAAFLRYDRLFPRRSMLCLALLWDGIQQLEAAPEVGQFLQDAFLSILPQAKYKDYRSKSQDLHVPPVQLREVNLLHRFRGQVNKRIKGLCNYTFSNNQGDFKISRRDFRDFLAGLSDGCADLVLTDPPWTDGNAYFEKAQLYHPWLDYSLARDPERLAREFVVTDAPSRRDEHDMERWWQDADALLQEAERVLRDGGYLALFFRPIPATAWLTNLNRLKLAARRAGFEPLLSIDVGSSDPSMRIQQSASYVFSRDIVFLFTKLPPDARRIYHREHDLDQYAYQVAEQLQEDNRGPFTFRQWRAALSDFLAERELEQLDAPRFEQPLHGLFERYCEDVGGGGYLPRHMTPFSGQLFDIPAVERLFTYTSRVVRELLAESDSFSYDTFLLRLAEYVENGTRMLIDQIERIDIRATIEPYARPLSDGRRFERRPTPRLPDGVRTVLELDPYDFEAFVGQLLTAQGYTGVGLVGRSGDRGVDLMATDPQGRATVVQCKRYLQHNVDATPVQRLHSFAMTRKARRMILVTTSGFTPQCKDEAALTGVELVDGEALERMIARYMPGAAEPAGASEQAQRTQ